jgi:PAS domain S-box-containing protein
MKFRFFNKKNKKLFSSEELNKVDKNLVGLFGFILLSIMLIVFIVSSIVYTESRKNEQRRLISIVAKIVNESVNRVSFSGTYHSRLFLKSLRDVSPDILYIAIVDSEGRIIAHSDEARNDQLYGKSDFAKLYTEVRQTSQVIHNYESSEGSYLEVDLPYYTGYENRMTGILIIGIDTKLNLKSILPGIILIFLFIFVLLAIALPMVLNGVTRIVSPVFKVASLLQAVKNATPDIVYYKDLENRLLGSNESFLLFARKDQTELQGKLLQDIIDADLAAVFQKLDAEVLQSGSTRSFGEWIPSPSGETVYLHIQVSPMKNKEGSIFGTVVLARDQTHSRKLEEEMIVLNRTLESRVNNELSRRRENEKLLIYQSRLAAMGEMIGNIAHQWRQPLSILSLLIQDIEEAKAHGELNDEYLRTFTEKSVMIIAKMSQTIDDFRNFFRPNKKKEEFNVCETVKEAINLVSGSFRSHSINLIIRLPEFIPAYGYRNEYSQVILIILNNAKDALIESNHKKPEIIISEHKDAETGKSVVCIFNNGGQINPETGNRIYDPYFTTKHMSSGTGIGLYMSKMIIEESMAGRIWHENTDGGVCFNVLV